MLWALMRAAAVMRHRIVWNVCGRNPLTWPLHEAIISAVYDDDDGDDD